MRAGRVMLIAIAAIAAVTAVTLVGVRLFVNPNDYKARLAAAVTQSTGRELDIEGDLKLSVFPWIGLEIGRARLGNTPGFGPAPLAAIQGASLRVRLLPLLAGRLEVGRLEIDGLDLDLQRDAEGRGNWLSGESLPAAPAGAEGAGGDGGAAGSGGATAPAGGSRPGAARAGSPAGGHGITLAGLAGASLKNARITYLQSVLENLDLDVGRVSASGPGAYRIAGVTLSGALQRPGAGHDVAFHVTAPAIAVDLAAGTLGVPAFSSDLAGAAVSGNLHGESMLDTPVLGGAITLAPLGLRAFMDRLGMPAPQTRDPAALSQLEGTTLWSYGAGVLHLTQLVLVLDQSRLTGQVSIAPASNDALRFDLAVDHFNVDHYLKPLQKPPAAVQGGMSLISSAAAAPVRAPPPGRALKTLDAAGMLKMGSLIAAGLDFTAVSLTLNARDGVLRIDPAKAQLYGGAYSGDLTIDVRGETPSVTLDQRVSGVDLARLLGDGLKSRRLSGRGNLAIQATAHGADADSMLGSFAGHAEASLAGGALEGVDLWYQVSVAEAVLEHRAMPAAENAKRTPFDAARFTATIEHGVATTKDLTIASGPLRVAGQGSTNLVTQAVDFHVTATVQNAARTGSQADIPIAITGTLAAPTVRPDLDALVKGSLRQRLQDTLKDKLKGLFGQ
jgi:AsmA protein